MAERFSARQLAAFRKHFDSFDLNKDGVISARELRTVSRKLGYTLSDQQIKEIMETNDVDDDGSLSFSEFLEAMPATLSLQEHRKAEIRCKFLEYDADGNGFVSADEAHAILGHELGFSQSQSEQLLKQYDRNQDGKLSYEEFAHFYSKVIDKAEQMKRMFDEFDSDASGSVSVGEAKKILCRLDMSEHEVETLVRVYDTNNDGELQYDEFIKFLEQS